MTTETQQLVLAALRRLVRQAFRPPPKRHRRSGFAGSPCDITCQPCALEQARLALEAAEREEIAARTTAPGTSPGAPFAPQERTRP